MSRRVVYFMFISLLALATFVAAGLGSASIHDWPFAQGNAFQDVRNLAGPVGSWVAHGAFGLLGRLFAWYLPFALLVLAIGVAWRDARAAWKMLLKTGLLVVLVNTFFALIPFTAGSTALSGGLGRTAAGAISRVLGNFGGTIVVITCLMLVLLTELRYFGRVGASAVRKSSAHLPSGEEMARSLGNRVGRTWRGLRARVAGFIEELRAEGEAEEEFGEDVLEAAEEPDRGEDVIWANQTSPEPPEVRVNTPRRRTPPRRDRRPSPVPNGLPIEEAVLPPLSLLKMGGEDGSAFSTDELKNWSEVLEDKLGKYGIEGRVTAVNQGPLVTTFEFEPAPGVKIKDIVSRSDDLALAMRARSLRLIAPIPGRAVVGIEIPNPEPETVYLQDVLVEIPDRLRMSGIMMALGVDADGQPFHMNLCAAPHLLMAGTTGSGKSVSLNTLLASILFQYRPSDVRLLLIDPKMVELTTYDGIPHLMHPVSTDPKEAIKILKFLIREMEKRNELFRESGVKNIESFNSKVALGKTAPDGPTEKLPYIVLVVDELADLVLTKGADFESLLSRLANMARAVGIHMIVATQRPSVDVIVGKTKANFPARIAFRVASKVDSRTILDLTGAEKLLGRGDMLYVDAKHPGALRIHGSWISEDELEALVAHWKQYSFDQSHLEFKEETAGPAGTEERDPLFDDAVDIVLQFRQGSTSLLQRKLQVGYARAARLVDQLEAAGIVGPPDGSKPREVLIREGEEVGRALDD